MADNPFGDEFKIPPQLKKLKPRRLLLVVLVVILLISGFFMINPEEVGLITRFGKHVREVNPGLHFKIPLLERVYKVPVERQQKLEFGFRTVKADVKSQYTREGYIDESLMLTGDLNLADVEWVVQYRIDNAYNYLFKVRNTETTLRDIAEAATRQIVGDRTVNEVLTVGRTEITSKLEIIIQEISTEYSLGVTIEQVVLQDINPPDPVKAAFNAVNEAQQEKETLINQAKSEYNKVIPKAKGQAKETIQKAQGFATERVNRAKGEVARFNKLYAEYIKAPEVTKNRIYLETMQDVIPMLGNKIITDESGKNLIPLLNMQIQENK